MIRAFMLLLIPGVLYGQFSASGGFVVAAPQGEFATKVGRNGYGGEISGAWSPGASPFSVGASLRLMNYGYDSRRAPFSTTTPGVFVDLTTTNNFFMFDLEGRLQPTSGWVRPYLSGMVGVNVLATSTTIKNESTGEEVASSTNENDAAFNYGAGAGVEVLLWTAPRDEFESGDVREVLLYLGINTVYGGRAKYLKEGSIIDLGGGQVRYDTQESKTDVMLYKIGVAVTF
ncbi:MAG: hypothetical protein MUE68_10475 [Bacteroidetes bacterium]|jgi:hypothetical protein|nr:hypothetical protein [Bacteroidota bacterium]